MVESDLIFLLPRAFQSDGFIEMFPFSASLFFELFFLLILFFATILDQILCQTNWQVTLYDV